MTPEQINKSIRQMRQMFAFAGILTLLAAGLNFLASLGNSYNGSSSLLLAFLYTGISVCFWITFSNLGKRNQSGYNWARISSVIFLLGFPIFTIFGISYLYKLSKPEMEQAFNDTNPAAGTIAPIAQSNNSPQAQDSLAFAASPGTDEFCPYCQHPNRVGARFCGSCGNALAQPGSYPPPAAAPIVYPPPAAPVTNSSAQGTNKKALLVGGGILALLLLFGAFLWYRSSAEAEYAAGIAAEQAGDCAAANRHFQSVQNLYAMSGSAAVAQVNAAETACLHLDSGMHLREQKSFLKALAQFEMAKHAPHTNIVTQAQKEYDATLVQLAEDTGADGAYVLQQSLQEIKESKIAS